MGIIEGYPNGDFGPSKSINRAELFVMLYRAANPPKPLSQGGTMKDIPNNAWFADAAVWAGQKKLLDFNQAFQPSRIMSRAEVAEALARYLEWQ